MRYEIFKQDAPNQPHSNIGSVHAPDAEMALMHARDVYGRRPNAVSMWAVPESEIYATSHEPEALSLELSSKNQAPEAQGSWLMAHGSRLTSYAVFRKTSQRRSMTYVAYAGTVAASTPQDAVTAAMHKFPSPETFVWWVCPETAISKTEAEAAPSWFEPAKDKVYRQQSYYGDVARQSRRQRAEIASKLSGADPHEDA
ncbi:MAG: phenylacetic acid degradation protein [Anaerolineae bacterium]|nr:phenylacetic acid degradation protein [Anaerolineae bacterium]